MKNWAEELTWKLWGEGFCAPSDNAVGMAAYAIYLILLALAVGSICDKLTCEISQTQARAEFDLCEDGFWIDYYFPLPFGE